MLPPDAELTPEERSEVEAARASCDRYSAAVPRLFDHLVAWAVTAPQDSAPFVDADFDLSDPLIRGTTGVAGMGGTWYPVVEAVRLLREVLQEGVRGPALNSYFAGLEEATRHAVRDCGILGRDVPGFVRPPASR